MRLIKYLVVGLGGLALLLVAAVGIVLAVLPRSRPAPAEQVAVTPERVSRGRYLFEHVAACSACHAERDFTAYAAPIKPATSGAGLCFPKELGLPGEICASNLTPDPRAGLGGWTDGEIIRAIREGVSRDGRALFPMMPYAWYRHMSDEDVRSIVAYLRSLAPLPRRTPPSRMGLAVSLLIRFSPKPLDGKPVEAPPPSDSVARGRYLAAIAACADCHSRGGHTLAGGGRYRGMGGLEISANLTPDPQTGLGQVTREEFIGRFKAFAELLPSPQPGRSVMPWQSFSGMSEEDLGALYDYLRTLAPVVNAVPRSEGI